MNKYAAWFFLAAICLSGCRSVTHRAEEAHFDSSSPSNWSHSRSQLPKG